MSKAIIIVLGIIIVFIFIWPRKLFIIRITYGVAHLETGHVPLHFIWDVGDILRRNRVYNAQVTGLKYGGTIRLCFSEGIPERCQQQVRNVWGTYTELR